MFLDILTYITSSALDTALSNIIFDIIKRLFAMYAWLYSNSMAILFKSKYSNWICRLSIPMIFHLWLLAEKRIFFSMCRRPSCSFQDPRSHNYKIKSQQRVFYRAAQYKHTYYSNGKWISSLCWTCTSILHRSCPKGCSMCLRPPGLLLDNAEQSNNHLLPFGWQHKAPIFLPEQSPQLLGQLVATHDS